MVEETEKNLSWLKNVLAICAIIVAITTSYASLNAKASQNSTRIDVIDRRIETLEKTTSESQSSLQEIKLNLKRLCEQQGVGYIEK
jgi:division protein CdvB (Snf7/Vps24/ESCRT-III family)